MDTITTLLTEYYDNHKNMEIQDAVKFLYQACMGPGHLITDKNAALTRLEAEWEAVDADEQTPLTEPLGSCFSRLNISACKALGLSIRSVSSLFFLTAQSTVPAPDRLDKSLELVRALPFSPTETDEFLRRYRAEGCPAISHSPRYRSCYHPAYRVISNNYVNLLPAMILLDRKLAEGAPLRVALDGPCASGKSTAGSLLSDLYDAPLIHMDDFFLRPEQRTQERLSRPGGNVDYERFAADVLSPLSLGQSAIYRPWHCHPGHFGPAVTVPPTPLTIIEGSYSLHPELREYYQLKIWVEAAWEERRQRLLNREGAEGFRHFEDLWIPLENRYFQAFDVATCCDICLRT